MRKFWNDEEILFLSDLYENKGLSLSEIYPLFNEKFDRTKTAIDVKIHKLKLKHTKKQISELKSRLYSGKNNGMYGKVGPNKGLTKDNCERIRKAGEKISKTRIEMFKNGELIGMSGITNPMYGKDAWNKGETKYTNDIIMKSSKNMSISRKKYWINLSKKEQDKIIGNLSLYANMAKKDTKIEIIIKKALEDMNINFIKNYRENRYIFDFYIKDYNCIIECQGDYWHGNPIIYKKEKLSETQINNINRDKRKILYIKEKTYNSIFMWENYIHKNKENMIDILDKLFLNECNYHIFL